VVIATLLTEGEHFTFYLSIYWLILQCVPPYASVLRYTVLVVIPCHTLTKVGSSAMPRTGIEYRRQVSPRKSDETTLSVVYKNAFQWTLSEPLHRGADLVVGAGFINSTVKSTTDTSDVAHESHTVILSARYHHAYRFGSTCGRRDDIFRSAATRQSLLMAINGFLCSRCSYVRWSSAALDSPMSFSTLRPGPAHWCARTLQRRFLPGYFPWFTPYTNIGVSSLLGGTGDFLAPATMCFS